MKEKKSFVKFLVIFFPVSLLFMAAGSLVIFEKRRVDQQKETPFSQPVTEKGMIAHYKKLEDFMTPRGFASESEVVNLMRASSFVEGNMSYMNTGMNVESEKVHTSAGRVWKKHSMTFKGPRGAETEVLDFNYQKMTNVELACALALAETLPNMTLKKHLQVNFYPAEEQTVHFLPAEVFLKAEERGAENALHYGGVDWGYLSEHIQDYLEQL